MEGQTAKIRDDISEICLNMNITRSRAVILAINFLHLVSKVPEYKIAFIDKKGNIVEPVDLEVL